MMGDSTETGYICHYEDLNKTLPESLVGKFQDLFSMEKTGGKVWRMHYNGK